METQLEPITYVTRTEEVVWGFVLMAFSLVIHGLGMVLTLHVHRPQPDGPRSVRPTPERRPSMSTAPA